MKLTFLALLNIWYTGWALVSVEDPFLDLQWIPKATDNEIHSFTPEV